jgi:hypothetical protein
MLLAASVAGGATMADGPAAGQPSATSSDTAVKGPRIQFGRRDHDFGAATSGPDLKVTFEFKNVGDDVLVIQKVKGG